MWVQDRAWDPMLEDPEVQIKSFWGYQLQSALSRSFRNRLHWNFVWKRVGHASVPWKLQKRLQGCSDTSKKLKVHPPRAQSERFEQSVPLFTIERSTKCGECQLRCNVILAPILRPVFMHSSHVAWISTLRISYCYLNCEPANRFFS